MADPQGNAAPEAAQGTGAPEGTTTQYMTPAEFNAAFSAREAKLRERLDKANADLLAKLDEKFAALKPPAPPETPPPADKGKDAAPTIDPALAAVKADLAKMQAAYAAAEQRAAAERRSRIETDAHAALTNALRGKVRDEAIPWVISGLRDRKALTIADDGTVSLKVRAVPGPHMPEEEMDLPLADAIPKFLQTKEAALFLPPPSGGAGGTRQHAPMRPAPQARPPYAPNGAEPRNERELAAAAREAIAARGLPAIEDLL